MFIFLILLLLAVLLKTVSVSAQTFISAQDPRILVSGRTEINADGISRSFDWEGTVFYITVTGSGPVYLNVTSTAGNVQRVTTDVRAGGEWYTSSRVWVNQGPNLLQVAVAEANTDDNVIRCFFELEPAFTNTDANGYFTVYGFSLANGAAVGTPMTPLSRNIEIVGDSISAGYGSMGNGGGCPVASWTSSNYYAWDQYICRQFNANCTVVAWSGKGMYQNCCDNGETMPSYYLQTRGGNAYVSDWDFTRFIPDAMLINLGTNDFNHDSGQSWEQNFTNTYIQFVLNATARYNRPKLPVFLAQGKIYINKTCMNSTTFSYLIVF
jgi:lysophospholipase L1-like esterase